MLDASEPRSSRRARLVPALALALISLLALGLAAVPAARAADALIFRTTLKDHKFDPAEIKVPAGKAFKLVVQNQDSTPEEFESHALKLEKVVAGGKEITISVRPLKAGTYKFVGEYHEDTAKGTLVAE